MATFSKTVSGTFKAEIRRTGFPAVRKTFPTDAEARAWARRVEDDMRRGNYTPLDRDGEALTVAGLVKRFKEDEKKAGRTIARGTVSCLGIVTKSNLGSILINRLTPNDIVKFAENRQKAGVRPQTVALNISRLSTLLKKYANGTLGLQIESPIREANERLAARSLIAKSDERDVRPTSDQLDRLRTYFNAPGKTRTRRVPMADIVDFAIATTMRASEITGLRWSDFNETKREILIRDRKDPKKKVGNHQLVPLLPDAMVIIGRQPRIVGEDRIFPFGPHNLSVLFPRACQALQINDLRFHDLRHEGISRLFEKGFAIQEVAKFSGHKDWRMLSRYTQIDNSSIHDKHDRLIAA